MLTLITGRAGTGKTSAVINEIHEAVKAGQGRRKLIVPEQYSHEAERELCKVCGDSLSLYAEVFSFTGLARRMMSELGGGAAPYLDKGGRLLCMALAVSNVSSRLKVYTAAPVKAELQAVLLSAVDELKAACITPDELDRAGEEFNDGLGDKLRDLALIYEAYDSAVAEGRADPADRLSVLAEQIEKSSMGPADHIYVDGFIDFTVQQRNVLRALIERDVDLTVCLTLDELHGDNEIFALSRRAARDLIADAKELGREYRLEKQAPSGDRGGAVSFFAENMFSYASAAYDGGEDEIELCAGDNMQAECEYAAAKALELVREKGCRWRDIAIAVRGFNEYESALENIFQYYGVPLYITKKNELLSKPLPLMISLAYEIIDGGWDIDDITSYMNTGLTGLEPEECLSLENYIFRWQLRPSAWEKPEDWQQHPDGYGREYDGDAKERLAEINSLRRRLSEPLLNFKKRSGMADNALGQAAALSELFEDLKLPEILSRRAAELRESGRGELAQEYSQLWDITVSALEQCASVLGDMEMDRGRFGKLFKLMLSNYDIGTIPVALDRVTAGDFDRMRRRDIKHLIVLGLSDSRVPRAGGEGGMFSDAERQRLLEAEIDLGGTGDSELWREFSLIYNCLTLPSESLSMSYPLLGPEGDAQRPAFVFNRAAALFGLRVKRLDTEKLKISAAGPAFSLAAGALKGGNPSQKAAAEYFMEKEPERCEFLKKAAQLSRGRLSEKSVRALYGNKLRLSASKIDKFSSCKFAYFCQYGLNAKPYEPSGFTPPEIGIFMHYVLENTAKDVKAKGGFKNVDKRTLGKICDRHVKNYIHSELNDFQEKSARFTYLFKRLTKDVRQVVADMAEELKKSDFEPLSFELDFSRPELRPLMDVTEGDDSLSLSGIADRVDGWYHKGKLYLRVVDYKTGRKRFSMSDVWYGMGLQMLLYLFALRNGGEKLYGCEVAPAGVMYVPARNALLSAQRELSEEEAEAERSEELRRSGLVLDNEELMEAWEHGEDKKYIPVKFKRGKQSSDELISAARLGLLSRHIRKYLREMAGELKKGSINADPYFHSGQDNACLNCDFFDACHFSDGENGEKCRYIAKLRPDKVWSMLEGEDENG
ncbi:MAG: PD-(D/E)XK nuclease family protein [Candidatus Limivicinus sp.]|jgi:ATP-dependent helicase/nuclease subunit B